MKNVKQSKKKTCLVFSLEEMEEILGKLFNDSVTVGIEDYSFDVSFDNYESDIWYEEMIEKLSEYFNIKVSSIHVDQFDYPLVWIVYKEEE